MTYHCHHCGRDNAIVNACRCDPNNLPTEPQTARAIYAVTDCWGTTTTDVALLDACRAAGLTRHVEAIEALRRHGCRYSNQDFDILAAAHHALLAR